MPGFSNVVKAVVTSDGRVLYFSRASVPYLRPGLHRPPVHRHHLGIYGFSKPQLFRFVRLPSSPLEQAEGLEQLRALENGIAIRAVTVGPTFGGIDTKDDLERARRHQVTAGRQGGNG
jgi:3-deoxy-manno-octulosonate cytidylyltransferase (CMP-KDO synthetase)